MAGNTQTQLNGPAEAMFRSIAAAVTESHPLAWPALAEPLESWAEKLKERPKDAPAAVRKLAGSLERTLRKALPAARATPFETTPRVPGRDRIQQEVDAVVATALAALERHAIRLDLTDEERRELLRGMILTRRSTTSSRPSSWAATSATTAPRSRGRASAPSDKKRSTAPRSACAAAPPGGRRRASGAATWWPR